MAETKQIRNWKDYNQALVQRGSLTLWLDEEVVSNWHACPQTGKRGRPRVYSNTAILCALTLKAVFNLPLRMTEGFLHSLKQLMHLDIAIPDYTSLCKRQSTLDVKLGNKRLNPNEPIHLVIDSTGLKILGEGEWKSKKHGKTKKRLWRKLHLGVNVKNQKIESLELSNLGTQDCQAYPKVVNGVDGNILSVIGDGAYDRFSCYEVSEQKKIRLIAPPQKNARTSVERPRNKYKAGSSAVKKRDNAIKSIRTVGRAEWKIANGYHKRSLAETAMYRMKTLIGSQLKTRKMASQSVEAAIWCRAVNKMSELGLPAY